MAKIAVVGTGYVGLVTGACFADLGDDVSCIAERRTAVPLQVELHASPRADLQSASQPPFAAARVLC